MNYPKGIDISFAQTGVNYETLCANIDFVIMKCGEKNFQDPQFESHYNGCSTQNVTMGVYFYGRAQTNEQAIAEAQLCASLIRGKNFSLPVFYDVEGESGMYGVLYPGPEHGYTVKGIIRSFLNELRNQGITSYGVYSWPRIFNNELPQAEFNDIYIWTAEWGVSTPTQVWGKNPDVWQYTDHAHYPGYSGNLDGDYLITQTFPIRDNQYYYCHPFGMKALDTIIDTYEGHGTALDLSLPGSTPERLETVGTPIYSICDGTVLKTSYTCGSTEKTLNPRGGNSIIIEATGTAAQMNNVLNIPLQFLYCHLVNPTETEYSHFPILKAGDVVRKGQIIGGLGASGNTISITGGPFAHLHLETSALIKSNTKTYEAYHNKIIRFQSVEPRSVGNIYNYAIFCDDPILTWMNIEGGGSSPEGGIEYTPSMYGYTPSPTADYGALTFSDRFMGIYPTNDTELMQNYGLRLLYVAISHEYGENEEGCSYGKIFRNSIMYKSTIFYNFRDPSATLDTFGREWAVLSHSWDSSRNDEAEVQTRTSYNLELAQNLYKNIKYGNAYGLTKEHTIRGFQVCPFMNETVRIGSPDIPSRYDVINEVSHIKYSGNSYYTMYCIRGDFDNIQRTPVNPAVLN